ncbi:MAG: sarcinarray family MAST domain-containing protein, partial [Methanosarcinales archaeon]|nr:sarcinarray family MAST domain-containing protein [Methanosarcinales archaeon]
MNKIILMLICITFVLTIQNVLAEPVEKEYGSLNAWFNGEEATVENIQLKVGEPAEIKVEVTSKIDGHVFVKLTNPLVTDSYEVVSGPSQIDKYIDNLNVESGWQETYIWTIKPTGEWVNGNAPINLFVQFHKDINDDETAKFTIANPYILDEQYSGPTPTHTPTD